MAWKAMTPAEVCDVMDFWADQPWPLDRAEVHRLAIERFGWTEKTEEDEQYLVNSVSGLTRTHVSTIASGAHLSSLRLRVTDVIRDTSRESTEFLGDRFTLLVREASARWGKPALSGSSPVSSAQWDVTGSARVRFTRNRMSITAEFETPQTVERERALGDR